MPEVVVFDTAAAKVNMFTSSFVGRRGQSCRILPTLSFHQTEIWAKPGKRNSRRSHGTFVRIPVILQATDAGKIWTDANVWNDKGDSISSLGEGFET